MAEILNKSLRKFNELMINGLLSFNLGKRLFEQLAEPYIAGHSIKEGMLKVNKYRLKSRLSTIDILGEAAYTIEEADSYIDAYKTIIDKIAHSYRKLANVSLSTQEIPNSEFPNVSVKPTAICAVNKAGTRVLKETPLEERLEIILKYAKKRGVNITLDMEDRYWTTTSLKTAQNLWNKGYDNLGIVLQSRLHRTKSDLEKIITKASYKTPKKNIRVRVCIGIYNETKEYAVTSKKEAKKLLIERIKELFEAGVYVEIATHDHKTIKKIIQYIKDNNIESDRFEFQFLKGVQNAYNIDKGLKKAKYKVRYYMPIELNKGDGTPYMQRRLIANPGMIMSGVKNVMQGIYQGIKHGIKEFADHL